MSEKQSKRQRPWDECICKDCGYTWRASETEHFHISFCQECFGGKIGGTYWEKYK